MSRFNAGRYVAVETAISAAVSVVLGVVPTIVSANGQEASPALGAPGLDPGTVLPLFMAAFMGALVPSLLTRRRQLGGRVPVAARGGPAVTRVVSTCLLLAASFVALGAPLAGLLPPAAAGTGLAAVGAPLLKAACGGLLAALVTPLALFLLFGRDWRDCGERNERAGDRPGTVADRLFGGRLQRPPRA